jgi:hypothetical protein
VGRTTKLVHQLHRIQQTFLWQIFENGGTIVGTHRKRRIRVDRCPTDQLRTIEEENESRSEASTTYGEWNVYSTDGLQTDCMWAILQQEQEDRSVVITFIVRPFRGYERHYCANLIEQEIAVFALERFHKFLGKKNFILRADCGALESLLRAGGRPGHASRKREFLRKFNFEIMRRLVHQHATEAGLNVNQHAIRTELSDLSTKEGSAKPALRTKQRTADDGYKAYTKGRESYQERLKRIHEESQRKTIRADDKIRRATDAREKRMKFIDDWCDDVNSGRLTFQKRCTNEEQKDYVESICYETSIRELFDENDDGISYVDTKSGLATTHPKCPGGPYDQC